ncbi:MAG TPA: 6-phosphofructokinase, partial [Anaerolineales bacterium]|nr:6-phosphofructokinase [Anaerolineales bacterium]
RPMAKAGRAIKVTPEEPQRAIGFITSGGDSPGMNAAVRAIVRTALDLPAPVYAITEGYAGMCAGDPHFRKMSWDSVGGILHQGGTVIGTARSKRFYQPEGRRIAVKNLVDHGIDRLVVIGGDGSLTGAQALKSEWDTHILDLTAIGELPEDSLDRHPSLRLVGLPGSIDNDLSGTDMTIGADTALHRITEAVDAIVSTAASHQRIFIVEVMGRNCGYLALNGALATGADWVAIPENPPATEDWEDDLCSLLHKARDAGRRQSVIILAEGARNARGDLITSLGLKNSLQESLEEEVRVTVLGHVQRGGSPSAFDRNLGTILGYAAVRTLAENEGEDLSVMIGMQGNRVSHTPLADCLNKCQALAQHVQNREFAEAIDLRGRSFQESLRVFRTVSRIVPHPAVDSSRRLRLAVMNAGAPAAGMNTAVRTAARMGLDAGHEIFGVEGGFRGLISGRINPLDWNQVAEWATMGGSMLGTNRTVPDASDFLQAARNLERFNIEGLLMIGGWSGYESVYKLTKERENFPAFNIPMICLPATIDNDLPGSEISIGADTALNNIIWALDKVKHSAVASRRCFVVEVMGRSCGYLAAMSGLASGAERVYLPEEGITLENLQEDLHLLIKGFRMGKRLGLMVRNENASMTYTTQFIASLFEEEGGDLFEVRQAILGHLQQGGDPSPFDRIQATRLATRSIEYLMEEAAHDRSTAAFIGVSGGVVMFTPVEEFPRLVDETAMRPKEQWWMDLRPIIRLLAAPCPREMETNPENPA